MDSLPWIAVLLIGAVAGILIGIGLIGLLGSNHTSSICQRCKAEIEEETDLQKEWREQQKGY
jgi:hypothetical protein